MKKNKYLIIFNILVGSAAIIATIVAGISYCTSKNANRLAEEANKLASKGQMLEEERFIKINRPYLKLKIKKFEESDSYFRLRKGKEEVYLDVIIEMENIGKLPAINLNLPEKALLDSKKSGKWHDTGLPDDLHLLQGDKHSLHFIGSFNVIGEESKINLINTCKGETLHMEMGVSYCCEETPDIEYVSFIKYGIKYRSAEIIDEKYSKRDKSKAKYWAEEGYLYQIQREYEKALLKYKKGIEINPKHYGIWINIGWVNHYLEKNEDAVKAFEKALKINPKAVEGLVGKGAALMVLRKYDEAKKCFSQSLDIEPKCASALYNLAALHSLIGDKENAIKYLKKTLTIDQGFGKTAQKDSHFIRSFKPEDIKELSTVKENN